MWGWEADLHLHGLLYVRRVAQAAHALDHSDGTTVDEKCDRIPPPHERVVVVIRTRVKPEVELPVDTGHRSS